MSGIAPRVSVIAPTAAGLDQIEARLRRIATELHDRLPAPAGTAEVGHPRR
jgi:hypothetical protein